MRSWELRGVFVKGVFVKVTGMRLIGWRQMWLEVGQMEVERYGDGGG